MLSLTLYEIGSVVNVFWPFKRRGRSKPIVITADFSRMESFRAKRVALGKYERTVSELDGILSVAEESERIRRRNHFGEDIERALGSD